MEMLYAALDVHKQVLQAAVLDPVSGELRDARFPATREALREWAVPLRGRVVAVAIEATSGWRWVWRELSALGFEVELAEPAQTRALRGKKRKAKNDRLDARWLALLLAKEMLPALVDPARGHPAASRPDPAAASAPPRPHRLGTAAARAARARGLALLAQPVALDEGAPLAHRAPA